MSQYSTSLEDKPIELDAREDEAWSGLNVSRRLGIYRSAISLVALGSEAAGLQDCRTV